MLLATIYYYRHYTYLFEGADGRYTALIIRHYFEWTPPGLNMTWNPMQGLGITSFFEGYTNLPVLTFASQLSEKAKVILYFNICTAQMFLSTYFLQRSVGAQWRQALCGSWVCCFCLFPLQFNHVPLGQAYALWPQFGYYYSLGMAILALYRHVGRSVGLRNVAVWTAFQGALILLVHSTFYGLLCNVLVLPLGGVFIFVCSESRREYLQKLAAPFVALCVLTATGLLPWLFGQMLQGARYSLTAEFFDIKPILHFTSIVFESKAALVIVILALVGSILMLRGDKRAIRGSGYFALTHMGIIVALSYFYLNQYDLRSVIRPAYFEYAFLPFYVFSALYSLNAVVEYVFERVLQRPRPSFAAWQVLCAGVAYVVILAVSTFGLKKYRPETPYWQETAVIQKLMDETGLHPGDTFRGRTVWLTTWQPPTEAARAVSVLPGAEDSYTYDLISLRQYDESHQALDMFLSHDIPTLDCYTQTLSVPFYLVLSRLASQAPWGPNFTYLSSLNVPLLSSLGVRFVLASSPLTAPGIKLSVFQPDTKGMTEASARAHSNDTQAAPKGQFLYEIIGANVGNYSPVEPRVAGTWNEALALMGRPDFDFTKQVILQTALPAGVRLTPAELRSLNVVQGGLRITANSVGASLLLIPFEFMNAMTWVPDNPESSAKPVHILRANLVMTGLLFEGDISGTLRCAPNPFMAGFARLKDAKDVKALEMKSLVRRDMSVPKAYLDTLMP